MTVSWGQGTTLPSKEGVDSEELVAYRSQSKMVSLPREEARQTPWGQVWVRAGDGLGPTQASVCKSERQLLGSSGLPRRVSKGNQHSLGTFWALGLMPDL